VKQLQYDISLTVQGPLLTKSSAPGAYGMDVVMARDGRGRPVIHGTHLVGKAREALARVGYDEREITEIFGSINERGDYSPRRKRLFLSDFTIDEDAVAAGVRHRIAIDPERRAALGGAICFAEDLFASGGRYRFYGHAQCYVANKKDGNEITKLLHAALRAITQLGGERTVGLGRLLEVKISCVEFPLPTAVTEYGHADGLELAIIPIDPFCVAEQRVAENLFESQEELPGGVLAGVVASIWRQVTAKPDLSVPIDENFDKDRRELGKYFDLLRFQYALPGAPCLQRPVRWPLSLARAGGRLWDLAALDEPHLVCGEAPAFEVDWKEFVDVREMFGWRTLRRELRVRTAIDGAVRRARNEALFGQEMI